MAEQTREQLKSWFQTGDFPTQQQFWDWMDSFFHKEDGIEIANVNGLQATLNNISGRAQPNNKEKILINNVSTINIVWTLTRLNKFGIFPKFQVWILGADGVQTPLQTEPTIDNPFTTMYFDFGTPITGFIILS